MSTKKILFTAHADTFPEVLENELVQSDRLLHIPLENFNYSVDEEMHAYVERELDSFAYVVYGSRLHARYFMRWVREYGQSDRVQKLVHLVTNQAAADMLESHRLPAVKPHNDARPIDLIEFLLRISHEGTVLYPSGDQKVDEIPGLLIELDMPFAEFQVYTEQSLNKDELKQFRKQIEESNPDAVIFHNESSVLRTQTAFPDLDLKSVRLISAGGRVTRKLQQLGFKEIIDANGSLEKLIKIVNSESFES